MVQLRFCSLEWTQEGARVVFPSGKEAVAWPHPQNPHYSVISHRLGYGDDLMAYCREHELAHAVIAQELQGAPSHVLFRLAHGLELDSGAALLEEIAAQALQRWARANERPILAGHDWDRLKAKFQGYCSQLERASGR
jgi:phytoene dehydrogenase-like protein